MRQQQATLYRLQSLNKIPFVDTLIKIPLFKHKIGVFLPYMHTSYFFTEKGNKFGLNDIELLQLDIYMTTLHHS